MKPLCEILEYIMTPEEIQGYGGVGARECNRQFVKRLIEMAKTGGGEAFDSAMAYVQPDLRHDILRMAEWQLKNWGK